MEEAGCRNDSCGWINGIKRLQLCMEERSAGVTFVGGSRKDVEVKAISG